MNLANKDKSKLNHNITASHTMHFVLTMGLRPGCRVKQNKNAQQGARYKHSAILHAVKADCSRDVCSRGHNTCGLRHRNGIHICIPFQPQDGLDVISDEDTATKLLVILWAKAVDSEDVRGRLQIIKAVQGTLDLKSANIRSYVTQY